MDRCLFAKQGADAGKLCRIWPYWAPKNCKIRHFSHKRAKNIHFSEKSCFNFLEKQRRYHLSNWRFRRETVQIWPILGVRGLMLIYADFWAQDPIFPGKNAQNTLQKCPSASARFCAKMSGGVTLKT